jgi:hypothetical protein
MLKNFSCTSLLFLPLLNPNLHHRQKDTTHSTCTACSHTYTHTCHLLRSLERLVNIISGWCNLIQNLYQDAWDVSSDQSVRSIDQRLEDWSFNNITHRLWITTDKESVELYPNSPSGPSWSVLGQTFNFTFCFQPNTDCWLLWKQNGLP